MQTDEALQRRLGRVGLEFQVQFHETALKHRPDDLALMAELGHAYTRLGRFEEGLAIDRRLVAKLPDDATVHYNLACSLSLCAQPGAALDALEQAVRLGYDDADHLLKDEDLAGVHGEARFQALLEQLRAAS